jgi:NAD(P)-dependent dehydrogenase (short-subunit alcohol dehydrogenase family)
MLSNAYLTVKHAIVGLARTAEVNYVVRRLRIVAICPGCTETRMATKNPDLLEAMEERVESAMPVKRMGIRKEIAYAVLYLAGGRSGYVVKNALVVDGGQMSR